MNKLSIFNFNLAYKIITFDKLTRKINFRKVFFYITVNCLGIFGDGCVWNSFVLALNVLIRSFNSKQQRDMLNCCGASKFVISLNQAYTDLKPGEYWIGLEHNLVEPAQYPNF